MDKESFFNATGESLPVTKKEISELVSTLPIPNQLPESPDLSHLPGEILRSSTVETLIHQNEDLLSRLSISLRRNSALEETISQLEKKNRIFAHKYSNIQDQLFVYKKKDELIEGKYTKYEEKISLLKKDLKLFETQYTELYSTSQGHISDLKSRLAQLSRRLGRHSRFKKRAVKIYKELKNNFIETQLENKRLLAEIATLTESFNAMKMNMAAAVERIQTQDKEHQKNISDLSASYESQIESQQKSLTNQTSEIQLLQSDLDKAQIVYEKNVELENQVLQLERKLSQQKQEFQTNTDNLNQELQENRILAKQKTLEVATLESELEDFQVNNTRITNERDRLLDQVESLQSLWRNNNEQLESLKAKYNSLQKLNQQISITLNDTRKQLQKERDQKETLNFKTREKINELESQVHLLSTQVVADSKDMELSRIKPQVIDHIQSLIAEVQSGVETLPPASTESKGSTSPEL